MSILFDNDGEPRTRCHACGRAYEAPHSNPEHDSIYVRFEQLQRQLEELRLDIPRDVWWRVASAQAVVELLRKQVLK